MIKIEVTGASIPEVADKLIAIGRSLQTAPAVFEHEYKHTEITLKSAPIDPVMPEVAEMAAAPEPVTAAVETALSPSDTATVQPETTAQPETSTSNDASAASSGSPELNFDTDVAPYVLQVVKEKGKPVAQEILSQFGVEKASLLDPARWPELVSLLKEQL